MAKDPAFLFYSQDFITGTMFMNNEQVGIYIRLLCAQHQHGGAINKTAFNSMVGENAIVRSKFVEDEDGFYNVRLMEEMGKRAVKSSNLTANAVKRWEKHNQMKCKSNANALQKDMPTEDENETEVKNDKNVEKNKIPELTEFLDTGRKLCSKAKLNYDEFAYSIEVKYLAWKEAGWKDGYKGEIKNWKTKLANTLPHLKAIKQPEKTW